MPLAEVPPIMLSEVLRDLDLVTVIAHESEEHGTSKEVLQRRGELVQALVSSLGLGQVRVEGSTVLVRGTRAAYRIQLATAAIYLETGQYLCIVPARKAQQAVYLPFAEGGETLVSEIVSKVLLLANDSALTDPTILVQLPAQRQAA